MTLWQILTMVECAVIITIGAKFHRIKEWVTGGVSQIDVNPRYAGMRRHSIAYVSAHGGNVRMPVKTKLGWALARSNRAGVFQVVTP